MATKNLSEYSFDTVPSGKGTRIGIIVSEWNREITGALAKGAIGALRKHEVEEDDILVEFVPGSFELPLGAKLMAEKEHPDAVILLGCVIQGETRHFDYICQGVTQGTVDLNLKFGIPFIFGVLTTNTQEQAKDRAGGKHGNKGVEAAVTALKMINLKKRL